MPISQTVKWVPKGSDPARLGDPAKPRSCFSGTQQLWGPVPWGHLGIGGLLILVASYNSKHRSQQLLEGGS